MKLMHAALAAGFGLSTFLSTAENSLFSAFRSKRDEESVRSERSKQELESIVESARQRVAEDPKHACEIVKETIRQAEAGPRLVLRIVEAVVMEVPEQMRLVAQCAVAVAPDSLEPVMDLMARLDPNAGEALEGAKSGPKSPKGGLEVASVQANPLDLEHGVIVIPTTNLGTISFGWTRAWEGPRSEAMTVIDDPAAAAGRRMNVVFIVVGDLGYGDLGCYGQHRIKTPEIDRLARRGLRLTQHYGGGAVGGSSRSVLLSGKHLGGARTSSGRYHRPTRAGASLVGAFRCVGYQTAAIGDWGLDSSAGSPGAWGFQKFYGTRALDGGSAYPSHIWDGGRQVRVNKTSMPGEAKLPEGEVPLGKWNGENYAPDLAVNQAVKFIQANQSRPFFLYLSLPEPRMPLHASQEELSRYPASWDRQPYRGENGGLPHPRPRAAYAAAVSRLDQHVGQVVGALNDLDLERSTIVVFTSDNGAVDRGNPSSPFSVGGVDTDFFGSSGGLRGAKGSLYEGGIRVPAIVSMPGRVRVSSRVRTPSYLADWLPTLCSAARVPTPGGIDGEDLWDGMTSSGSAARSRPMVWTSRRYGGQVAVRLGDHKVIRRGLNTEKPAPWEVYDLSRDSDESRDIAAQRPELVEQATAVLKSELGSGSAVPVSRISR